MREKNMEMLSSDEMLLFVEDYGNIERVDDFKF
jgi:hypothetical protein